jgi:hypothetical protein
VKKIQISFKIFSRKIQSITHIKPTKRPFACIVKKWRWRLHFDAQKLQFSKNNFMLHMQKTNPSALV